MPTYPGKIGNVNVSVQVYRTSGLAPRQFRKPFTFLIESRSIVPTNTTSSRKRGDIHDIITWVECFNSYIAVITSFRPEQARDLLAYVALIIRIAKRFPRTLLVQL